jgi:hypothetical protein
VHPTFGTVLAMVVCGKKEQWFMVPINYGSQQGMEVAVANNLSDAGMLSLCLILLSLAYLLISFF